MELPLRLETSPLPSSSPQSLFSHYRPKVKIHLEVGSYVVKTLEGWDEIKQALTLRHEVFQWENNRRCLPNGLDVDELDVVCDHLGIFDTRNECLTGVYRLRSSQFSRAYYAHRRFDISPILSLPGVKLELGRACVKKEHRKGITLALLWRGISEYMKETETAYLFGSASIRVTDRAEVRKIWGVLIEEGHRSALVSVAVRPQFQLLGDEPIPTFDEKSVSQRIPPLFRSYLRAGAKVCSEPALDEGLGSTDFLTLLEVQKMSGRFERKYCAS